MFSQRDFKLNTEGLRDWKDATCSRPVRIAGSATWMVLEVRLVKGLTTDKQEMALTEAERDSWSEVPTRLVAIIQSLETWLLGAPQTH